MSGSPPAALVIDVSVVVKWFVPESDSAKAAPLRAHPRLLAPELVVAELGNVFWKKVRLGQLAADDARLLIEQFRAGNPVRLVPLTPLLDHAFEIATQYDRTVYDSLYLALALAENCPLVTADARFVNALRATPLAGSIVALDSL